MKLYYITKGKIHSLLNIKYKNNHDHMRFLSYGYLLLKFYIDKI